MPRIRAKGPEDIIAAVPHIVSYEPENSVVVIPVGMPGPVARIDLPPAAADLEQCLGELVEVYTRRVHAEHLLLVAYGDEYRAREAMAFLRAGIIMGSRGGTNVDVGLCVNGNDWVDVFRGTRGQRNVSSKLAVDSLVALEGGAMPFASRAALLESLNGSDRRSLGVLLPERMARADASPPADLAREVAWLETRIEEFLEDGVRFSDEDAARAVAVAVESSVQDLVATLIGPDRSGPMTDLWRDLVARTPDQAREGPATLLGLSAFLNGNGALANIALDEATRAAVATGRAAAENSNPLAAALVRANTTVCDPASLETTVQRGARPSMALLQATVLQRAIRTGPGPTDPGKPPQALGGPSW